MLSIFAIGSYPLKIIGTWQLNITFTAIIDIRNIFTIGRDRPTKNTKIF